jgi:hypothetical protein
VSARILVLQDSPEGKMIQKSTLGRIWNFEFGKKLVFHNFFALKKLNKQKYILKKF